MTRKFLVQVNRLLTNRGVKRYRLLNRFRRGFAPTDDFNQRNEVWRIEWMPDEYALGVFAICLHDARRYARSARRNDRVRRRSFIPFCEQLDLEINSLWSILLNEVGLRKSFLHIGCETESIARCSR